MKRLFARVSKPSFSVSSPSSAAAATTNATSRTSSDLLAQIPGLSPKFTVPAMPHPCPHDHLALLPTSHGLLVRPHAPRLHPDSHVRISWGKRVDVEEIAGDRTSEELDWKNAVIVYGIVGIVELYDSTYLMVVSSRSHVGNLLDITHAVYGVKGVTAIPLTYERATVVLNTLAAKHAAQPRPSLIPGLSTNTIDTIGSTDVDADDDDPLPHASLSATKDDSVQLVEPPPEGPAAPLEIQTSPRVKFAEEHDIKVLTPLATRTQFEREAAYDNSPPSPSSDVSTPASDISVGTGTGNTVESLAKTLANRLSFWGQASKRTSVQSNATSEQQSIAKEGQKELPELSDVRASVDGRDEQQQAIQSIVQNAAPVPPTQAAQHSELENKVVREIIREYTKGGMYFAYNFDITRSLQHKHEAIEKARGKSGPPRDLGNKSPDGDDAGGLDTVDVLAEPDPTLPLWRRVDRQFWWNEWLSKPFVDAGLHSYVLPIMQGYYQVSRFHIPREPEDTEEGDAAEVDYILASRRSRDRAGLRYQRRGIDDDARVANFVETETIVRVNREGVDNVFSYVQIRGSIPLYWAQPGMSLKPAPVLSPDRTHEQQLNVIRRHFQRLVPQYGPNTIVNLAEQHGKEAAVTCAYRDFAVELDWADVQYNEYDFHKETKGMKYENISRLIEKMERTFEHQGYLWISNNLLMSKQKGVFRVNCIDCLDRTNVVQSAFARHALNRQLGAVALLNPVQQGRTEVDIVFNDIWANNGDAISRAYAGTSALKGDFTRTGKRDLAGLLNDGINSLSRMYTSTFGDWFSQAVIDFALGNRTVSVFSEFLLKLQSSDPQDLIRVTKIRAEAIATCVSRVLPEGERLLNGWTLFAPENPNVRLADKWEEKVLLLTAKALYIISYDYNLEKVKVATKVPLGDIIKVSKGAYIVSPLEESSRDPNQNAGFVVQWTSENQETRVTSYAVRNTVEIPNISAPSTPTTKSAFSPPNSPTVRPDVTSSPVKESPPRESSVPAKPMRRTTTLSQIISKAAPAEPGEATFAAFKAFPVDPARSRQGSSGGFADVAAGDDLSAATNAAEAVEIIVAALVSACADVGNSREGLLVDEDIVSLADAQRTTSVYAKMEYGVKRLLWLGN